MPLFLVFAASGSAFQVSSTLLKPGKYPPGDIYKTEDLPKLVGKKLTAPAYLVGDFLYVGKVDGKDSFASFTSPPLRIGNTAVIITFHSNFPAGLVPGRAIKADSGNRSRCCRSSVEMTVRSSRSAKTFLTTKGST